MESALTFDSIRLLIEERITTLSKMFCCLVQVSYLGFNKKKVEGQTLLGFVLLIRLSLHFVSGKLYLDAKSPRVYTVYGRKISLRLVQLNLVSLGTKGNYKKVKKYS